MVRIQFLALASLLSVGASPCFSEVPKQHCSGFLLNDKIPENHRVQSELNEPVDQAFAKETAHLIKAGRWSHRALSLHGDVGHQSIRASLAALRMGLLSIDEVGTQILRWEAAHFIEGARLSDAQPILDVAGEINPIAGEYFFKGFDSRDNLSPGQLKRFREELAAISSNGRYFWLLRVSRAKLTGPSAPAWAKAFFRFYSRVRGTHVFFRDDLSPQLQSGEEFVVIVPSLQIMRAYLRSCFAADAVSLLPDLGLNDASGVLESIGRGGRVLALRIPMKDGLEFDEREENELEGDLPFNAFLATVHDFYHAWVGSHLPVYYRKAFPRWFSLLQGAKERLRSGRKLEYYARPDKPKETIVLAEDEETLEILSSKLVDLAVGSINFVAGRPLHERLRRDFGRPFDNKAIYLIFEDIALHPDYYEAIGLKDLVDALRKSKWVGAGFAYRVE